MIKEVRGVAVLQKRDVAFQRYDAGFSAYQGVLVLWDEDYDARVLGWIDSLSTDIRAKLCAVEENEGGLSLIWRGIPPAGYEEGASIEAPEGDTWAINRSRQL